MYVGSKRSRPPGLQAARAALPTSLQCGHFYYSRFREFCRSAASATATRARISGAATVALRCLGLSTLHMVGRVGRWTAPTATDLDGPSGHDPELAGGLYFIWFDGGRVGRRSRQRSARKKTQLAKQPGRRSMRWESCRHRLAALCGPMQESDVAIKSIRVGQKRTGELKASFVSIIRG